MLFLSVSNLNSSLSSNLFLRLYQHTSSQLRLAMMLIGQVQQLASMGDKAGAEAKLFEADDFVNKAKSARPKMSEVYQVAGSICELRGDVTAAMEAHDKAIAIDPKNPTPYINKGMLISQTAQPTTPEEATASGTAIMELYKKAIEVDPLCSQAQKLLAEMKLRVSSSSCSLMCIPIALRNIYFFNTFDDFFLNSLSYETTITTHESLLLSSRRQSPSFED
jgi:tetratricopeptide (TPR) repeat protein